MTFANLKLRLAIRILLFGMLAALAYHFFQGWVLGRGYPYNTFLFLPAVRFTDFYDVLRSAKAWDPYSIWSLYFPFTYVVFHPLSALPGRAVLTSFFALTLTGLWWWLYRLLCPVLLSKARAAVGAGVLLGGAYPVWLCLDRGNIEVGLLLLICGHLLMIRRRRYWAGLGFLVLAMCIKLYPAIFLALLCRRGRLKYAVAAGALFLIVTLGSLATFKHAWHEDLSLWRGQVTKYRNDYIVGDGAMGGSASLWNPAKLGMYYFIKFKAAATGQLPPRNDSITQDVERALFPYSLLMLALVIAIAWYVSVVETEFWRKVVLLGLFLVISAPGGADYKLVYVSVLLAATIALTSRRRFDLMVVALLALVLIPKKYWFFPQIVTDSGTHDASLGVVLNPMLMLAAAALLCRDGWRCSTVRGRALRWTNMRTALKCWPPARSAQSLVADAVNRP